jgi:hypothetical protein
MTQILQLRPHTRVFPSLSKARPARAFLRLVLTLLDGAFLVPLTYSSIPVPRAAVGARQSGWVAATCEPIPVPRAGLGSNLTIVSVMEFVTKFPVMLRKKCLCYATHPRKPAWNLDCYMLRYFGTLSVEKTETKRSSASAKRTTQLLTAAFIISIFL